MPDALKRLAECAPNRRFVVELATDAKAAPEVPPTMADVALGILQRDAIRDRDALAELTRGVAALTEAFGMMQEALVEMAKTQAANIGAIEELSSTLARPVRPIYDAKGKLIGAERVK